MTNRVFGWLLTAVVVAAPAAAEQKPAHATYSKNEILAEIEAFFGEGAEGLAEVVEKTFDEHGEPNAYIAGDEVAAVLGIGLRYGKGRLLMKHGQQRPVYWQGPSIGFDVGASAAKVFILLYRLADEEALFQRFPGIEGSLYFVGGVGVNYLRSGDTVVAPIRLGAGWRQGVSAGYIDFTREASVNPF